MPKRKAQKDGWYSRVFAWALPKIAGKHSQLIEPWKIKLFSSLRGTVLEIGPGSGANLRYFPAGIRLIGIEPNPYMHPQLLKEAERLGVRVELHTGVSEDLPVEPASVDAVVSSLVLCSVTDLEKTLAETLRVLRPGGKFVFVEHVGAKRGSLLRLEQDLVRPLWKVVGDGCNPNRDVLEAIEKAGFARVEAESFSVPGPVVSPHLAGVAYKAG